MKSVSIFAALSIAIAIVCPGNLRGETTCDVKRVIQLDNDIPDVTVITKSGDMAELRSVIDAFVEPVKIETGVYEVSVRRKASNLYEIRGRAIQIETRYCYQYTYGQDAILKITSASGWSIGKLIFE